jgi:hypothetical protein
MPTPQVTVNVPKQDAPVVNVAAPQVTVQAKPEPKKRVKVIRDNDGRMTGVEEV